MKTDILIIGAGGAGLRAAIQSVDTNANVIIVGKTLLGKAHTVMAEGGINAALGNVDPEDNWKIHFRDTMCEGQFINNWRMVEILAKEASQIIIELENFGVIFDRTKDGKIMQRAFGGHTYRRTCHIADRTGLEIMQALSAEVRRRDRIKILEEIIITKLFKSKENRIIGAMGISLQTGKNISIQCKAIILAAGGLARIYKRSTNAWETVGDGYALALETGAELQDMEMIQFHPTGMVYPESAEGMLVTESVRGEGGILLNKDGERFMEKYDPKRMELSTRDVVARAVYQEILDKKGTDRGGVWLDISHKSKKFIEKKLPKMIMKFKKFSDIDITKEKMEVAPTAHYAMGGVKVDPDDCQSMVKGLFSAGEITAGVHGANRLGGNSLADILIFGKLAGTHAARYSKKRKFQKIPQDEIKIEEKRLTRPFKRKKDIHPTLLKNKIQKTMWKHVGVTRDKKGLDTALKEITSIKKQLNSISLSGTKVYNQSWIQYIDLLSMIPVCEMIIKAAILRKESRGAHYRKDYPNKDQTPVNTIIQKERGKVYTRLKSVPKIPKSLKRLCNEN